MPSAALCAVAVELEGQSGAYLMDCAVTKPSKHARNAELARALWRKTDEMLAAALSKAGIPASM